MLAHGTCLINGVLTVPEIWAWHSPPLWPGPEPRIMLERKLQLKNKSKQTRHKNQKTNSSKTALKQDLCTLLFLRGKKLQSQEGPERVSSSLDLCPQETLEQAGGEQEPQKLDPAPH